MSKTGIIVSFDGPAVAEGRIDVRELAPALLSLANLIDSANQAINGDALKIKIEAKATAIGSFEISIDVVLSTWQSIINLLEVKDVQKAEELLEWIGLITGTTVIPTSLIKLYRFLEGKKAQRVVRQEGNTFKFEIDGKSLTVPYEVMRAYQDVAVNRSIKELVRVIENDTISEISFRLEGEKKTEHTIKITSQDKVNFEIEEPKPVKVIDETRRVAFSIRSLAFQEGNKWRLYDGQNIITATIEDQEFISRVDRNIIRFAKGDVLICEVRTIQLQSVDGLKTEHNVIKVIEHRQPPLQIDLPFE